MIFKVNHHDKNSKARTGEIKLDHGVIETPVFMPVGTVGSVKAVHMNELQELGYKIILGNTYHLYLRPGIDILEQAGGLHKFNNWNGALLTDSGGYQVYSLGDNRKIKEQGVHFSSHIDGSKHLFTPENVVDVQRKIGADIMMAFDECTPYPCDKVYATKSMEMTHRWLKRCRQRFEETDSPYGYQQYLFPIVQGSVYPDLRKQSAEEIANHELEACAIGGLSVGEPADEMYAMTEIVCSILPENKPRYLMGVGTPENILESIALGIDMFDCVMPTRNGRNGTLFTSNGIINIKNKKWENDFSPIDENSLSETSKVHTKAYLRHLIMTGEILGLQIASLNNLALYQWIILESRRRIADGSFTEWKNKMTKVLMTRL